jgi:zinc protease
LHRDRVAKVTPAEVGRVARQYLQRNNRTVGLYIPTDKPERADIPQVASVVEMVKDYKGGEAVVAGEFFDPTPANIEKRVQRSELPGGVKVALLPKKTRGEVVQAQLTLHYGNAESLKNFTSASQFLGELMARGTKKHTRQELVDELDKLKARLSASGSFGTVTFSIECKRDALPRVLALLTEILREPTFPADELDILKRQTRDELDKSRTEPTALASRKLQQKLSPYPKDDIRYVPTVEESIERLDKVTADTVRKLYSEQLGGQNGELVVVGDFDPAQVTKLVGDALKDWKPGVPYKRIERPAVTGVKGERLTIETPDKANAIWIAGLTLPITDAHPDNPALELADFVLGGGTLSSRLGNRVRQKEGLSYGVRSQFGASSLDPNARVMIYAICNPANIDKVDKAILEEVDKMLKEGVGEQELAEAKKAFLEQAKVRRSSDRSLVSLLQDGLHVGRTMDYHAEQEKKIAELTVEEVNSAFKRHYDPKRLVIIKGGDFRPKPAGTEKQ